MQHRNEKYRQIREMVQARKHPNAWWRCLIANALAFLVLFGAVFWVAVAINAVASSP